MLFHVTLDRSQDGWVVAECPAFPGCVSQGRDEQETIENMREAITAWLWAEDQKAVAALLPGTQRRLARLLERCGLGPCADPDEADPLLRDQTLLAELYGASVQGRIATGPRAGNRITTLGAQIEPENPAVPAGTRCASVSGTLQVPNSALRVSIFTWGSGSASRVSRRGWMAREMASSG